MTQDSIQPVTQETPFIVLNPSDREVRRAVYDFVYSSSLLSGVVFLGEFNNEPATTDTDEIDTDSHTYGTTKGDILDRVAEGRTIGSLAVIAGDGTIEIIPPLNDKQKEQHILQGLTRVAEEVVLKNAG